MKVLILGATGFIGFPAAQALSRAGYFVYGQTRSSEKAKRLAADEIFPVICNPDSSSWHHLIPTLDVIIDTVGGDGHGPDASKAVFQGIEAAAKNLRPSGSPKLSYIFTSGTWVHGDQGWDILSDTTPVDSSGADSAPLVNWRPGVEQQVVKSQILNGIVVRPSLLYGRSGSIIGLMFDRVRKTGKVTWPARRVSGSTDGKDGGRMATIHQDDLADFYVRAAERAQVIGGLIFDVSNAYSDDTDGFLGRMCEVAGVKDGFEYYEPTNLFEKAITTQHIIRPYLARSLLGWEPKKPGLTDGLGLYWNAYLAHCVDV
ncbi:hypothetical protein D9758_013566 [Tetrapyrgos nigripes]|uniref:NAD-dependent epimerase/dehydratase domain-containing protein n=1 Tax=Tetrapyrgos nigripes TaxID=182062 RepID=A0A8H5FKS5_9AGAR|nr:hypothetical protein D9758_013566 [Tetrapyrgos nigripes]